MSLFIFGRKSESGGSPREVSPEEIRRMVARLFVQADKDGNFDRLKELGDKATPYLIAALDDPITWTKTFKFGRPRPHGCSPFERIGSLLAMSGSGAAARALARYLDHPDRSFRRDAAEFLGRIGKESCIEPVQAALRYEEECVRGAARYGIRKGTSEGHQAAEFLEAVYPTILECVRSGEPPLDSNAEFILLTVDPVRAEKLLLSPEFLKIENPNLHTTIRVLNETGRRIPPEILLPIMEAASRRCGEYPFEYVFKESLLAYARNPDGAARERFEQELKSPNPGIAQVATEALAILSGVPNAVDVAFDIYNRLGPDALSIPQKYFVALYGYKGIIDNGGHRYFFERDVSAEWRLVAEGLNAVGAPIKAGALKELAQLFGEDGPPADLKVRHRVLSKIVKHRRTELEEIEGRFFRSDEDVYALLFLYAIANKEHFIDVPTRE